MLIADYNIEFKYILEMIQNAPEQERSHVLLDTIVNVLL